MAKILEQIRNGTRPEPRFKEFLRQSVAEDYDEEAFRDLSDVLRSMKAKVIFVEHVFYAHDADQIMYRDMTHFRTLIESHIGQRPYFVPVSSTDYDDFYDQVHLLPSGATKVLSSIREGLTPQLCQGVS